MIESLIAPLASDESYLNLQMDMTEALIARLPSGVINLRAMAELIQRSEATGFEITRGPEVVDFHLPEYPGDESWVRVMAVGRQSS